jgi:excisionase family DNA binding protein
MKKAHTPDLTTSEAAELLGVTERTIRNMIERGSLNAYKMDPTSKSVYKIPAEQIQQILRAREAARQGEAV